jgi:UDP-GlcNAc:undecaprenyl-phosphate GlcNAc-1-phosphate transferase
MSMPSVLPSITLLSVLALLAVTAHTVLDFYISRARRLLLMDLPGGRHLHLRPVPVVGGLAVINSWMLGLLSVAILNPAWAVAQAASFTVIALGALGLLALGLADDRRGLTPRFRLAIEFAVAGVTIACEPGVHRFCAELATSLGPASYGLTALGIVAVVNAMNLVDGLDGLAASIFVSTALSICALTQRGELPFAPVAALMLVPGLAVFLRRNWNPARVFLGDQGSLPIGYILVVSALQISVGESASHTPSDLAVLAILFGYPVLDMLLCLMRRLRTGRPLFSGDRGHLHHRMLRLGLSVGDSASSLVVWQVAMIIPAALIPWLPTGLVWLALLPSIAVATERLFMLERIEASRSRVSKPVLATQPDLPSQHIWADSNLAVDSRRSSPSKFMN